MNISEEKNKLRKILKKERDLIGGDRGEAALAAVSAEEQYKICETFFCYMSFGSEISTHLIAKKALEDKKILLVPRTLGGGIMEAVRITSFSDLKKGNFGIMEPKAEPQPWSGKIDFALVPGIAFDKSGARLGYGGGYYDRFLRDKEIFSLGICQKELLKEKLPKDEHDILCSKVCGV